MRVRCLYEVFFLQKFGISAIVLYPFILFADSRQTIPDRLFRHELQHIYQVQAHGWFGFYWKYLLAYFRLRRQGMNHQEAYFNNPFEIEARGAESLLLTIEERQFLKIS